MAGASFDSSILVPFPRNFPTGNGNWGRRYYRSSRKLASLTGSRLANAKKLQAHFAPLISEFLHLDCAKAAGLTAHIIWTLPKNEFARLIETRRSDPL
jgi:hypothetical protein